VDFLWRNSFADQP
jgi:hypothetical protein